MESFWDIFNPEYRVSILKIILIGTFLILFGKLIDVMVFSGPYYYDLASGNRTHEEILPANRGLIYDRNGVPLVINIPAFFVTKCQSGICKNTVLTQKEASLETDVKTIPSRFYPYAESLAHVIGYTSFADGIGVSGIEAQYNTILTGKKGVELIETNANGRKLKTLGQTNPVPGKNIYLNLDLDLQKTLYEQLKDKKGAAVASDPYTGAILALVSAPSFDPNIFTKADNDGIGKEKQIESIFQDNSQPLFNRSIGATYPPGSTFKIVSSAAGLESGAITKDTRVEDTGVLIIGPFKFPNWKWLKGGGVEGELNIVGAIKRSNDIFFYKTGEWVGIDKLTDWASKFGLGKKLSIDIPGEAMGLVPDKKWRDENTRDWYLGDTYHLAIGQADLLVTPLQVNFMTAAMANGGKICKPYLLNEGITPVCRDIGIKKETIDIIREGMAQACSPGGTAWPLFDFKIKDRNLRILCKTGTAEFGDPKNHTHAWLTSFVDKEEALKFNRSPVAITVIVEAGGEGSDVAAPIVKKALETWFGE